MAKTAKRDRNELRQVPLRELASLAGDTFPASTGEMGADVELTVILGTRLRVSHNYRKSPVWLEDLEDLNLDASKQGLSQGASRPKFEIFGIRSSTGTKNPYRYRKRELTRIFVARSRWSGLKGQLSERS